MIKAITLPIAMNICVVKKNRLIGYGTCEAQIFCSENKSSAVTGFTDSEARIPGQQRPGIGLLVKTPTRSAGECGGVLLGSSWVDVRTNPLAGQISNHRSRYTPSDGFAKAVVIVLNQDRTGSTSGLIGVSRDVTERKRLEEQLLQSHKMEAIGRLAGGIAHDFNNILTTIIGYAEFSKLSLSVDDSLPSSIDQIRRAADRAAGLTRQLLAFARKQIIKPKAVNVNDLILKMNNMLARLVGENLSWSQSLSHI
jgi:signal transduction histidine kinase